MKITKREIGLLGLIIYFTFIGGTFYSQLNLIARLATQLIVILIFGLWLLKRLRRGEGLPATPLDVALGFYLAVNGFSAAFGLSPRFSFEGLWFTLSHILAFYLLVDLLRRGWAAALTWAFFMASAAVCVVGLAELFAWYFGVAQLPGFALGWWPIGGWRDPLPPQFYRLAITLNGSTPLAAYLALFTPVAIGLGLTLPRRSENRRALLIWLGLAFVVQILTFSRAGVLALMVSLGLLALGWFLTARQRDLDWRGWWRRAGRSGQLLGLLAGLLLAGSIAFWLRASFSGRAGSTNFRFTLWETALTIFQQHWLSGAGPGNFGRALLRLNQADLPRHQIATAHNVYLNTAAELGLLGLLAGALLLATVGWVWWQRWRQIEPAAQADRLRLIAVGAALVGLAAQTLVDAYTATPNVVAMLALVAYLMAGVSPETRIEFQKSTDGPRWTQIKNKTRVSRVAAWSSLILLLLYAGWFVWLARADFAYQRSFWREARGDLAGAIDQAALAHRLDPGLPLRAQRLALLEARLASQSGDARLAQSAAGHYETALRQEPILGLTSANLAGLWWQQGQADAALDLLRQTIAADEAPLYWVNLGYFLEQQARWTEAAAAYGQALALAPALAGSGFWQAGPERAERWPEIVAAAEAAPAGRPTLPAELALARGDFATLERLLAASPADSEFLRGVQIQLDLQQGRPGEAQKLLPARPRTGLDYWLVGRVQRQLAADAEAEKSLLTAAFLGEQRAYFDLGQLYESRGDLPAAEMAYRRGFSPHAVSENEAVTIYGRLSGIDLAPQLLRIGLSHQAAAPWLALARLYETQARWAEAEQVYRLLLAEDPFLTEAEVGLAALAEK